MEMNIIISYIYINIIYKKFIKNSSILFYSYNCISQKIIQNLGELIPI